MAINIHLWATKGENRSTASIHILYVHVDFHLHSMMRVKCSMICKFSYLKDRKRIFLYRPNISTKSFQLPLIIFILTKHLFVYSQNLCKWISKIKREKLCRLYACIQEKLPPTWGFNGVGFKYINLLDEKYEGSSFSQLL